MGKKEMDKLFQKNAEITVGELFNSIFHYQEKEEEREIIMESQTPKEN